MDGTLTDSMWVWDKVDDDFSAKHNVTLTPDDKQNIHAATFSDAVQYLIDRCASVDSLDKVISEMTEMATYEYVHNVPLVKGADKYLAFLRSKGIRIYLLTGCTPEMAYAALKARGVFDYFDGFYFADKPHLVKTKPTVFSETLKAIKKIPSDCVLFEDMPFAIKTAKELGIYTVTVVATKRDGMSDPAAKIADLAVTDYTDERIYALFD